MKERKALLEDAKAATQAALEEGIVPGGGVALIRSEKALDKLDLKGDEAHGVRDRAQRSRLSASRIAENAGLDGAVVVNRVRKLKGKNEGYDADKEPTATWSRPASSIRPRSFAPLCRTRPASPRCADHRIAHHRNPQGRGRRAATTTPRPW